MKKITYAFLSACMLVSAVSHAATDVISDSPTNKFGFYLEPGLSYQVTQSNINYSGGLANSSADSRGVGVIAKLGMHLYERFFVAADVRYGIENFNDNANHIAASATSYDVAPVIGYQMKEWGMRAFVGYVVAGNFDPDTANGVNLKFNAPTGFRAGVGLKLKMLSVNVEWQQLHYGTVSVSQAGNTSQTDVRYNPSGLVASLTFPIEL